MLFDPNSLKDLFPRIYNLSMDKDKEIENVGCWSEERWSWNFSWRRSCFDWELGEMAEFQDTILPAAPINSGDELWLWTLEGSGTFSTKSAYTWLHGHCSSIDVGGETANQIFKQFWKTKAPPKVLAFSWQAIRKRIRTKQNMFHRQIIRGQQDLVCEFCNLEMESVDHLLLTCNL